MIPRVRDEIAAASAWLHPVNGGYKRNDKLLYSGSLENMLEARVAVRDDGGRGVVGNRIGSGFRLSRRNDNVGPGWQRVNRGATRDDNGENGMNKTDKEPSLTAEGILIFDKIIDTLKAERF